MSNQWIIFTRVRIDCPTERVQFSSREEADAYLAEPVSPADMWTADEELARLGIKTKKRSKRVAKSVRILGIPRRDCNKWQDPVPVVPLSARSEEAFAGPWLHQCLKIDSTEDPTTLSFEDLIAQSFRDRAAWPATVELGRMCDEGLISSSESGVITREERRLLLERSKKHELPEIRCALGDNWNFFGIDSDANQGMGHVQLLPSQLNLQRLSYVALDLEESLCDTHNDLTAADIFSFWTSLDVWEHIAEVCRMSVSAMSLAEVESIRMQFMRLIGSFARKVGKRMANRRTPPPSIWHGLIHGVEEGTVQADVGRELQATNLAQVTGDTCSSREPVVSEVIDSRARPVADGETLREVQNPLKPVSAAPAEGDSVVDSSPTTDRESSAIPSSGTDAWPPRRTPDLETSRRRIELMNALARELATIKPELNRFCTVDGLKRKFPDLILWSHLRDAELKELVGGTAFKPKAYAENLVLREFGITSRETLKKDRRKLRNAGTKRGV